LQRYKKSYQQGATFAIFCIFVSGFKFQVSGFRVQVQIQVSRFKKNTIFANQFGDKQKKA
jgi:hypothetical protein